MSNLSNFPNAVDSFQEHSELSASQYPLMQQYQALVTSQTPLTPDQQTSLTNLTNELRGSLLFADDLNFIQDSIVNTQSFFLNSVNGYITNAQNGFDAEINKFTYKGSYNPSTTYYSKNIVTFSGQTYICLVDGTVGVEPDKNTTDWALIAQQGAIGPQGPAGATLSYVGTYNALSTYQQNQLVSYNGSTYVCLQNNTTGYTPTNTTYWTLFVTGATPQVQNTAPTNPATNQLWVDTSGSVPVLRYWSGTAWIETQVIVSPTNTATSSNNYGSSPLQFQRSTWNGTSAVTETSYLYKDATGVLHYVNSSGVSIWQIDNNGNVTTTGITSNQGSSNNAAFIATSSGSGWGSGMQFINTTPTTGKKYGIYSGSEGKLHFVDIDASTDRIVIDNVGNVSMSSVTASGLTGATATSRYVGATTSGAPTSGTFNVGDWVVDQSGAIWICTVAGTSGTWTTTGKTYTQGTGITISGTTISNAGVTSVNGQTGAVTVSSFNPLNNPSAWIG